jgi:acyl-coenzyme A thioesterase PaaI-like protein
MAERGAIDGVSEFFGLRWESFDRVRVTIRPELVNPAGLLSGAATYALVDYCMGSILPRRPLERLTRR